MAFDDVREIHVCRPPCPLGADATAKVPPARPLHAQQRDDAREQDGRHQQAESEGGGGAHAGRLAAQLDRHRGAATAFRQRGDGHLVT
ncbi:MAG TPA: hypothetical protein PLV13_04920, partial [Ilumatobacteraceae bacterium]|nr:hypothetical protein [Ilumatobacteraceae bacterium]